MEMFVFLESNSCQMDNNNRNHAVTVLFNVVFNLGTHDSIVNTRHIHNAYSIIDKGEFVLICLFLFNINYILAQFMIARAFRRHLLDVIKNFTFTLHM